LYHILNFNHLLIFSLPIYCYSFIRIVVRVLSIHHDGGTVCLHTAVVNLSNDALTGTQIIHYTDHWSILPQAVLSVEGRTCVSHLLCSTWKDCQRSSTYAACWKDSAAPTQTGLRTCKQTWRFLGKRFL